MKLLPPVDWPRTDEFLTTMPRTTVDRLLACGWRTDHTVFLQMPFHTRTTVATMLARDFEHGVFWRALTATEGFLEGLAAAELRVVVDHEQEELRLSEDEATCESGVPVFADPNAEQRRHVPQVDLLKARHGEAAISCMRKVGQVVMASAGLPNLVPYIWVCVYLLERHDQFIDDALPMTGNMNSQYQRERFCEQLMEFQRGYRSGGTELLNLGFLRLCRPARK